MNISFGKFSVAVTGAVVLGVVSGKARLIGNGERLDTRTGGQLSRAIRSAKFDGKFGEVLTVVAPAEIKAERVVLVGLGEAKSFDAAAATRLGGRICAELARQKIKQAGICVDPIKDSPISVNSTAAHIASGAKLRSYRFDKYRTRQPDDEKPTLSKLTLLVTDPTKARAEFAPLSAVADGVFLTRDLVSEPANILYPAALADQAKALKSDGVTVEVLNRARLEKLGMGALLGVAQGSSHDPYVVVMRWNGAGRAGNKAPLAFVGKGVTFDTGGISIKPSGGMEDMKWDMGGSGVVIGLMRALARRKAKVNVVGIVGLVENMPSGTAQRPGDIVTSMSGQTIEVINTDAEGRLVLADVLWYVQQRFKPSLIVDLATLTGAIIVALGNIRAGLFCNDDSLSERLVAAGDAVGERLWRLPMDDAYDKQINSPAADMKNVGSGRGAGSITGAKFIERFIEDTPWAHIDIAGVTWSKQANDVVPQGGTGFGVRLLDHFVASHHETKR